jgi:uncharacterized membrane protein YhaH (DUF805 family)
MDWQTLFLKVEGRMGRKDYWIGIGILFVAGLICSNIPVLDTLWPLASVYFGVCVYGKRLHDIGQSAWMTLLPFGILVGAAAIAAMLGGAAVLGAAASNSDAAGIGALAGLGVASLIVFAGGLAALGWVIWLGTRETQAQDNQFGPPRAVPLVTAI